MDEGNLVNSIYFKQKNENNFTYDPCILHCFKIWLVFSPRLFLLFSLSLSLYIYIYIVRERDREREREEIRKSG